MLNVRISCAALLAILAAAGCAGGETNDAPEASTEAAAAVEAAAVEAATVEAATGPEEPQSAVRTTKTGPAIEVGFALRSPVKPGDVGVATLTIRDDYPAGTLTVAAASKTGLGVFPTSASTSFGMEGDAAHLWDVYFQTDAAGAHYLDIHVTTTGADNAMIGARSFSFKIAVGDVAAAASKTGTAPVVSDENGEKKIIMDAEETIVTDPQ